MRLKDKVAIITGGSRGIGYATADKFLKEGATVILTASSQGSADKAVAQLKEKYPDATVAGISPNLSNLESVRNAFREAASKYGCIDILVNNAGVAPVGGFFCRSPACWPEKRVWSGKIFSASHSSCTSALVCSRRLHIGRRSRSSSCILQQLTTS